MIFLIPDLLSLQVKTGDDPVPLISTIPKQRKSSQQTKVDTSHYSHPICPPRPVRPVSPPSRPTPILKPARPRSPRWSSSSDEDTPPPRPQSPVLHPPLRSVSQISQSRVQRAGQSLVINHQDLNRGKRGSSSYSSDVSRSVTPLSRPITPLLSKQNSGHSSGMFTPISFSSRNRNYEDSFLSPHQRYSSDLYDSDYGAYQVGRAGMEERALSRMASSSYISENDYSAFTPIINRKTSLASVCSTPLQTPKLNRDFGFVSSKTDGKPKPPRRRSKETNCSSRAESRQDVSSSRETTPVNSPAKSPSRPNRRRGKNYVQQQNLRNGKKSRQDKPIRPRSLQENCPDPGYEILTPVCQSQTFHSPRRQQKCYISSSDSDSDFRTPQASPKCVRPAVKNKGRRRDSVYEEVVVGSQSHLTGVQRNSRIMTTGTIPPRTSQEPIPTPRRSRDQSSDSLFRVTSLGREPHYKVPPPNPRPVTPPESHFYSELIYEEDKKGNEKHVDLPIKKTEKHKNQSQAFPDKQSQVISRKTESSGKERINRRLGQENYPSFEEEERQQVGGKRTDRDKVKSMTDSRVSLEFTGEEDRFYDAKEEILKKTKAIATLPNGSKYPCVIVQKKSKKNITNSNSVDSKMDKIEKDDILTKPKRSFKNYTPVEMKMKPDWLDQLKPNEIKTEPQPSSIVNGILYTSVALIDEENQKKDSKKMNSFSLIEPEVFQTYDVCRNYSKDVEQRLKVYRPD